MNTMEEILWSYIDGNCTPEEQVAISKLIAEDEAYRLKYGELLKLNQEFSAMELDEPSMAFTYNVMEVIRTENAQVPLKAAINKRIIIGISIFFAVTLIALLVFAIGTFDWSAPGNGVNLTSSLKMPAIDHNQANMLVRVFLFFDVILGLYLFDAFLRKRNSTRRI